MQTTSFDIINGQNINEESFYNCCQLAKITRYADPIAALKATGEAWSVTRDNCGNILTATKI